MAGPADRDLAALFAAALPDHRCRICGGDDFTIVPPRSDVPQTRGFAEGQTAFQHESPEAETDPLDFATSDSAELVCESCGFTERFFIPFLRRRAQARG